MKFISNAGGFEAVNVDFVKKFSVELIGKLNEVTT